MKKAKDLEEPTHGECPFCHRVYRFRFLLRHMKRKHPGWVLRRGRVTMRSGPSAAILVAQDHASACPRGCRPFT